MRKRQLVFAFGILSIVFLFLQLFIFDYFSKTDQKSKSLQEPKDVDVAHDAIRQFMEVAHKHGLPVFLIDPVILERITSNQSSHDVSSCSECCRYLCVGHSVTEFGVLARLWKPKKEAVDDFVQSNFRIQSFMQNEIQEEGRNTSTHLFFDYKKEHVIHLIIFYLRGSNYFWHGKFKDESGLIGLNIHRQIKIGIDEGVYNGLDMAKVTLDGVRIRAPVYPSSFLKEISDSRFIGCNFSRSNLFFSKYGKPSNRSDALQFWKSAKDLLKTASRVLNEIQVRFWLSSGTCLGWFRQCDLISYSKDVDIGIWIKDYDVHMIKAMENVGLELVHLFGRVNDSFELSFSNGEIKLDVFFFYEEQNHMWNGGTQAKTGHKFKYIFPRFTLCWTEFLGLIVRVPCETRDYVEANYGPNWFEPVKVWDWKKSPSNVQENGQWADDERKRVIQLF